MTRPARAAAIDASAMTLSGLCLIHCLLLPLVAVSLPVAGVLAEAEWVHKAFVAAALPISGFAIARSWNRPSAAGFAWLALTGLALLCAGAFVEPLHDHETALTVLGAVILAGAHLWRWVSHARP
jgi:hypothetical protein